ncbi:MAG: hypothetical protein R3B82_13625 [Sandaracinaceae bacterium]
MAACFLGDTTCRAFGDPGTTEHIACVNAARDAHETTASQAAEAAYCALCPSDALCSGDGAFGAPFPAFAEADLTALEACMSAGTTCDDANACLRTTLADLIACFD